MQKFQLYLEGFLLERLPNYPGDIKVAVFLTLLCLFVFLHLVVFILARRAKQFIDQRRDAKYKEIISNMLAHIVLYDDMGDVDKAVRHFVPRFRKLPLSSSAVRELLVQELLEYHANFTGKTAEILKGIYLALKLDDFARRKIRSWYWERQVTGIHEFTQLWIREEADRIFELTNSKNATLRMEAQASFIKLSTHDSFRFLDHVSETILEWHQLVLFEVITKTRNVKIPSFGQWLSSSNDSVVILCLKLIDHYQQLETIPQLIALLGHENLQVRSKAIQVLGKLEAEVAEPVLHQIYPHQPPAIQKVILKAMGRISSGNYLDFLASTTESKDFDLIMVAVQAIKDHGRNGMELLRELYRTATVQNKGIIDHVLDSRIKG